MKVSIYIHILLSKRHVNFWFLYQCVLDQRQYIDKMLSEFGMSNCKPIGTPMVPNAQFLAKAGETNVPYQSLIGVLNFIANSARPDILYSVVRLSQFNNSYNQEHWSAAHRVLRY
jgi:hypothetical protein